MARAEPGMTIVRGARVVDPARRRAEPGDILIRDGLIAELGPSGMHAPEGARVFDAAGLLVHPGLVNAHTHGHGGLSRGQGGRWTLELLLTAAPWITGGGRTVAENNIAARICAAEMALKGVTAAYDLFSQIPLPTQDGMDAAAEAYAEVGLRAVVAPMVADLSFYQAIPGLMDALPDDLRRRVETMRPGDPDACLAAMETILRNWRWASHDIHAAIAPTIPHHCTERFICGCAKLARDNGVRLHTHLGESRVQAVAGMRRYGRSLTAQMDAWGVLGPDFTAAHAIWLDGEDMRRLADRGASVAHNPVSNMRLGNGVFRFRQMRDMGITIGLGSDGVSSSDSQSVYGAMRAAFGLSAITTPDPKRWIEAEEAWHAATEGGAAALGIPGIGRIAPGCKADLVFLDLTHPNWLPHNATVNQLVHVEDGTAVRHVMVGGRQIVRDGKLLTLDLAKLAAEAETARARLEAATGEAKALVARLSDVVSCFCVGLAQSPYPLRRYAADDPTL